MGRAGTFKILLNLRLASSNEHINMCLKNKKLKIPITAELWGF